MVMQCANIDDVIIWKGMIYSPVATFSYDPDIRAERGKQSEKLEFRFGENLSG